MKKFIVFILICFTFVSCDYKAKETITNYVSFLTDGGDFTITKIEHLGTITDDEGLKNELTDLIEWCDKQVEWRKDLVSKSYSYCGKFSELDYKLLKEIETHLDKSAEAEVRLQCEHYYKPLYRYCCEYTYKGLDNTIYLLLEDDVVDDKYNVKMMTEFFFNLKP